MVVLLKKMFNFAPLKKIIKPMSCNCRFVDNILRNNLIFSNICVNTHTHTHTHTAQARKSREIYNIFQQVTYNPTFSFLLFPFFRDALQPLSVIYCLFFSTTKYAKAFTKGHKESILNLSTPYLAPRTPFINN